jgi:alpha-amylase
MGVILQAAYRRTIEEAGRALNITVPSPADPGTPHVDWWYDHIAKQASEFAGVGFSAILLPPVCKTSRGAGPMADGYSVYDDYDIGNKNQFDSVPTRFGSREQLQRLTAVLHANGIDVYADMVPHQRSGGLNATYKYLGSGAPGRFPKHPSCFVGPARKGMVPRDPIAGPVSDDFNFGDELATVNSLPKGYVLNGLIDAGDWLTRTLDLQGYRIDDTKGQVSASVLKWSESKSMNGKLAIGEYDDGNRDNINSWVWQSGIGGRVYAFDFPLHYTMQAMCNNAESFDMSQLDHAGYAGISPLTAITFVENPDTDTDGFAAIIRNKMLAYAYMLTTEGYPMVYYRDYSTDENCYGLKTGIDNLVWIHEHLAGGDTVYRWKDPRFVVYERLGHPNLLVGLNNNGSNQQVTVTVETAFGPHVQLHDYSGHAPDLWTDQQGRVLITIPAGDDGLGYACYSRTGMNGAGKRPGFGTVQTFFGASDLDIGPATPSFKPIGRIWCDSQRPLSVENSANIEVEILGPDGMVLLMPANGGLETKARGWHTIKVKSTVNGQPFDVKIGYHAPVST